MKTTKRNLAKAFANLAWVLLIFLAFSCSQDGVLDENLDSANAKSQKADLKTLIKGAAIQGANGLDIGPDGNLYIASVNGQNITVMNKNNGKIINQFGPVPNGVQGPDDLVISPDGNYLYWTDLLTGYVGRMDLQGNQDRYQLVAPGVNPIGFSPEGRLFVALDFLGDGLYELDPDLVDPPRPIIQSSAANPYPLGFLNAFDFGTDGRLYGPLFAAGMIISIDVGEPDDPPFTGNFTDWVTNGSIRILAGEIVGTEKLHNPPSAKFDPEGMLTAIDQSGKVFKIDINSTPPGNTTLFTTLPPGLDNMVFDTDGSLYMTNADDGWVAQVLKSGQAHFISPGGMIAATGLAVMPGPNNQEALYQADLFRLREFNATNGRQENVYKGYLVPENLDDLILPMNVTADGNDLIICSWFSPGLQVWNPEEGVKESYPHFETPIDAARVGGQLVASDLLRGGVIKVSDESVIAPLYVASGLATDGTTLWAADWATGDIWEIDFTGGTAQTPSLLASGLQQPEGLALDGNGGLLVMETGTSSLRRVDLDDGTISTVMDNIEPGGPALPGTPPTWGFDGVAVGPSGDIYVTGGAENIIYKIPNNKLR